MKSKHSEISAIAAPGPWSTRQARSAVQVLDVNGDCIATVHPGRGHKSATAALIVQAPALAAQHSAESLKDCRLCDYCMQDTQGRHACVAHLPCVDGAGFTRSAPVQLWDKRKPAAG